MRLILEARSGFLKKICINSVGTTKLVKYQLTSEWYHFSKDDI